jgi:hypothetical protein
MWPKLALNSQLLELHACATMSNSCHFHGEALLEPKRENEIKVLKKL